MIVKTIPSSWIIEEEHRLDCGPFVKGSIEAKKKIERSNYKKEKLVNLTLDGINGMYHVGQDKILWVSDAEHGLPFLRSADILKTDLSHQSYISKRQVANNYLFQCPAGTTLITRSGTIGKMAYCRKDMENTAISQDVLKVVPDTTRVLPGYLYAVLSSRFGLPIITGGTFGSIIVHIEAENIANLPVPRLGKIEEQAHEIIQKAAGYISTYQEKIQGATSLLFDSVGISDISTQEWHSWGSDLAFTHILNSPNSLRALNFNPRYLKLVSQIKKSSWKPLTEICNPDTIKRGGWFKRVDSDPEHSYLMVGQKQIFRLKPEGRWIAKKFINDDLKVKPGTTLIAAVGTLADSELYCRCEFIWGKSSERVYSEHFYQIYPIEKIMHSGCLFAFLRSETAFRMLRSISHGTKLQIQKIDLLKSLPIPYPKDESVRNEIHKIIIDAYEIKDQSIDLEDQARNLIEEAIEKGGR